MKKKTSKFEAGKLSFSEVRIIRASIDCPEVFDYDHLAEYHPKIDLSLRFSLETNIVLCILKIDVETESSNDQIECESSFLFHFYFEVSNLNELINESKTKGSAMDTSLSIAIAGVSYSTARGILISRFQGTVFSLFILPVVSPGSLLKGE